MSSGIVLQNDWEEYIHPNGWKYFSHRRLHVVTNSYPTNLNGTTLINPPLDDGYEAIMDSQRKVLMYVNHSLQYASQKRKDIDSSAVKQAADTRADLWINYWNFMYCFPAHHGSLRPKPNSEGIDPLPAAKQVLNFFKMDILRRKSDSEAPFTLDQCKQLLEQLNVPLPTTPEPFPIPSQSVALHALVAWILWTAAKHYKLHQYGQHLHQGESEPEKERNTFFFHFTSSVLLFGAPRSHLERIRSALKTAEVQDRTDAWTAHLTVLERELTASNLGSTVLLSSTSAFLAVPGLDKFTRIVTLICVVLTLGSVMTGLYLQWQTGKIRFKDVKVRPTALAILFSIPFAALVWSVIMFTVSVIMYSVLGTPDSDSTDQSPDTPSTTFSPSTWISVLAVSCVIAIIVGITVFIFRVIRYKHSHRVGELV